MDENEKTAAENQEQPEIDSKSTRINDRRRSERREPWLIGIILIIIGVVFLIQNLTGIYINNWWALFIMIPALESFSRAWQAMQAADGRLTSTARKSLIGGLVLTTIATILFFNLDWVIFGPILLIVAGAAILLNVVLPK
jgi:hypothetical protein